MPGLSRWRARATRVSMVSSTKSGSLHAMAWIQSIVCTLARASMANSASTFESPLRRRTVCPTTRSVRAIRIAPTSFAPARGSMPTNPGSASTTE